MGLTGEFENSLEKSLFQVVTMKKIELLKHLHMGMLERNHPTQLKILRNQERLEW